MLDRIAKIYNNEGKFMHEIPCYDIESTPTHTKILRENTWVPSSIIAIIPINFMVELIDKK